MVDSFYMIYHQITLRPLLIDEEAGSEEVTTLSSIFESSISFDFNVWLWKTLLILGLKNLLKMILFFLSNDPISLPSF